MPSTFKRIKLSHKKTARQKCLFFSSSKVRKKVFVNTLSTLTLKDFLVEQGLKVIEGEAFCDNFFLSEAFNIADLKVGNARIDVRCIVNNQYTQLWIPKKPYDFGYVFDFYVAVSLDTTKDRAEIVGYVSYEDIESSLQGSPDKINYYVFDASILRPPLELASSIIPVSKSKKESGNFTEEDHNVVQELFTTFLDDELNTREQNFFHNHINKCDQCRETLLYLYLFDSKIKTPKLPMVFLDESIPIEEAFARPERLQEEEITKETDITAIEDYDYEDELETIEEIEPELIQKKEIKPAFIEEAQEIDGVASEPVSFEVDKIKDIDIDNQADLLEEAIKDREPFRNQPEEHTNEVFEQTQEDDIQPEESFIGRSESSWQSSYDIPDQVFSDTAPDVFGQDETAEANIFSNEQDEMWQQYPTEGDVWHEEFGETVETFETPQDIDVIEELPENEGIYKESQTIESTEDIPVPEGIYEDPTEIESLEDITIPEGIYEDPTEIESLEDIPTPEGIYEEPTEVESIEDLPTDNNIELSEEERLLNEAKAAEDYIAAQLQESGVELSITEKQADDLLTLESLEEEHFDTLESYDENIDFSTIEQAANFQDPLAEDAFTEFIPFQETKETTSQEHETDDDTFEYMSDFDEDFNQSFNLAGEVEESSEATLEDLEKEFDTIASFNFEDETQSIQPSSAVIDPEVKSVEETQDYKSLLIQEALNEMAEEDDDEYQYSNPDATPTLDISPNDMFEVTEDLEHLFDAPSTSIDSMFSETEIDTYTSENINYQEETEEITYAEHPNYNETESYEPPNYHPAPLYSEETIELPEQSDFTPIDQSTESVVPSDEDLADIKNFVETQKDEAKKTKKEKKQSKGLAKKFFKLAAALTIVGGIVAGVMFVTPMLSKMDLAGESKKILASLPKFDSDQPAIPNTNTQTPQQQQNEATQPALTTPEASNTPADKVNDTTLIDEVGDIEANKIEPASSVTTKESQKIGSSEHKDQSTVENNTPKTPDHLMANAIPQPDVKKEILQPPPAPVIKPKPKAAKPVKPTSQAVNSKRDNLMEDQEILHLEKKPEETTSKPVKLQDTKTIAMERQEGASFLPPREMKDFEAPEENERLIAAGYGQTSSSRAKVESAPTANPLLAGLEEKEESIKFGLNPKAKEIASIEYKTTANAFWKPASSMQIDKNLKEYINSATHKSKSIINSELKEAKISGDLRATVILIKINNSTNSISHIIVSSSGSSRVDNLILNAVQKGFSRKSLPKSSDGSTAIEVKLTVTL